MDTGAWQAGLEVHGAKKESEMTEQAGKQGGNSAAAEEVRALTSEWPLGFAESQDAKTTSQVHPRSRADLYKPLFIKITYKGRL